MNQEVQRTCRGVEEAAGPDGRYEDTFNQDVQHSSGGRDHA